MKCQLSYNWTNTKQPASIRYGVLKTLCWLRAYALSYAASFVSDCSLGLLFLRLLIRALSGRCACLEADIMTSSIFLCLSIDHCAFVSVFVHGIEHDKDWTRGLSWGWYFLAKYRLHWLYPSIITLLNHFWLLDGACNVWTDPRVSKKQSWCV